MQLFGSLPAIIQYVLAFAIILGLLAVLAAALRRITGNKGRVAYAGSGGRHNQQQRLGVIDAVDIDAQRQLLLLRRDNVEHLVLIGGPNDLLVESGIGRGAYRAPLQPPQPQPHSETGDLSPPAINEAAGNPARAASDIAPPFGAAPPPSAPLPPPPAFPSPPPPRSLATPVASRQPPAATSFPEADPFASLPAQAAPPAKREPSVKAEAPASEPAKEPKGAFSAVASQLEEALKRPFAAVRPSSATGIDLDNPTASTTREAPRAPSPAAPVKPAQTSTPVTTEAVSETPATAPTPPQRAELPIPPRFPARDEAGPSIQAPEPARPVKRTAPPTEAAPAASERQPTVRSETVQGFDSLSFGAPSRAPAPPKADPFSSLSSAPATGDRGPAARSGSGPATPPPPASPRTGSAPGFAAPPAPTSETPPAEQRKSADPADTFEVPRAAVSPSGAKADKPASADPFDMSSLENIEAEFARLLGRTSQDKSKDK